MRNTLSLVIEASILVVDLRSIPEKILTLLKL